MYDVNFGYINFEDIYRLNSAYFAESNNLIPQRLSYLKTGELPTDTVFLSNLTYDAMYEANLNSHAKFRRDDFLGEAVKDILVRLGFTNMQNHAEMQEYVPIIAKIFNNVMAYCEHFLNFEHVPIYNLKRGIREVLTSPDPIVEPAIEKKIIESENYFTSVQRNISEKRPSWLGLYLPPFDHCHAMFFERVPNIKAKWEHIKSEEYPKDSKFTYEYLREQTEKGYMGFVMVRASEFKEQLNELVNFGSNAKLGQRRWVTTEEAMFLASNIAKIEIEDLYLTNNLMSLDFYLEHLNTITHKEVFSLSGMIFLNNLWGAATQSYYGGFSPKQRKNIHSPFIRFRDRFTCLLTAINLINKTGFSVLGYGSGKIFIDASELKAIQVLDACREIKLFPPLLKVNKEEDINANITDPFNMNLTLWGQGKLDMILKYDDLCIHNLKGDK